MDYLEALAQWVLNSDASAFYEEAGEAAAALGLTVDIFAMSPRTCGLNAIEALASGSGGCIRLYPSPQHATMPQVQTPCSAALQRAEGPQKVYLRIRVLTELGISKGLQPRSAVAAALKACCMAQDVYRCLVGPRAFRGLLRLRALPALRISQAYSPLRPVPDAQDLWQLPSCSHLAAVGFDFEYTSSAGFSRSKTGQAILQMALQYSMLRPQDNAAAKQSQADGATGGTGSLNLQDSNG